MSDDVTNVDLGRRRGVLALGLMAGAAGAFSPVARAAGAPIEQPADATPASFMARAVEMRDLAVASGDQGYGAIVVRDGRIVGEAPSRVVTGVDPTAHAEMEAIRDAARRLGSRSLARCVLYSTSPPCAMCETAAYWAGIERKVHGDGLADGGAPRYGGC